MATQKALTLKSDGSNPSACSIYSLKDLITDSFKVLFGSSTMAVHHALNVKVVGSNPTSRLSSSSLLPHLIM
jgi:hypothetical protein